MVIACLALAVALGGTGYAAVTLPTNSVGTTQLKSNAVVSAKVRNRSLLPVDFKQGQLPRGERGPTGPTGRQGPRGAAGAAGPPGASATALWAVITSDYTLARGSGVTSVTGSNGAYGVIFNRDVSNCAYETQLGGADFRPNLGFISAAHLVNNPNGVLVYTWNADRINEPRNFHLAVFC
jgi:hypothetical protein